MTKSTARHYALIRIAAPPAEVDNFVTALRAIRGMHRVDLNDITEWDKDAQRSLPTGWRKVVFYGTDRAVQVSKNLLTMSGLQEPDENADHDHAACVARAYEMGVPAHYAHTPETYLSM